MRRAAAWACGLVAASLVGHARGADEAVPALGGRADRAAPAPLWELGLGAAALRLPDYRGSDQSRTYLLPLPYIVYRGEWLRADRDGARALLLKADRLKVDVSVAASVPTRSRDNDARSGMPNLPATVEIGPNVNYELLQSADRRMRLELRLPVRAAVAVQRSPPAVGATFSPNLNLDLKGAYGWNVGLLAGPLFADRKYHEHFYGVDAAYATPQRPEYHARGGYAGWHALGAVSRRFGSAWVGGFVRYDSLGGAVFAASPLVRRDHEVTAGIGISWVFATSRRLVTTDD
ncbi:MAG: MipA/OmpV family protein [Caldimonas sp.]